MTFTPKEKMVAGLPAKEYHRRWRAKMREHRREYRLLNRYGLTIAEYEALFKKQGGVCAICKEPETARWMSTDRIRPLSVDHDHRTNEVRGLLCHNCNRVLGLLSDDPKRLSRMLRYLEKN